MFYKSFVFAGDYAFPGKKRVCHACLRYFYLFKFIANKTSTYLLFTPQEPNYAIEIFAHLKLCLATATHNFK